MNLPSLTADDIRRALPEIAAVGSPQHGGQKVVFSCEIAGQRYAVKFMLSDSAAGSPEPDASLEDFDEVTARARREVAIMGQLDSPHLVKLGPLPITQSEIAGQNVTYFTEEWIDGDDLRIILGRDGPLPVAAVLRLGRDMARAINSLWSLSKIHRDIKPGNIMRRSGTGEYVLLDMGLAFDLEDISLSLPGTVPGTLIYFSPEQTQFAQKRQMDFRSDLFSLGIVLYEAATGEHPFWKPAMSSRRALANILTAPAQKPSALRGEIPPGLDAVILRLLAKRPHLRYRTCAQLVEALDAVLSEGGR